MAKADVQSRDAEIKRLKLKLTTLEDRHRISTGAQPAARVREAA